MNVQINRFSLEGCRCRLKFDPKELQDLLYQYLEERAAKNKKHFDKAPGGIVIDGAFTEIDEGNFALHFMLAFLGKARIVCRAQVSCNGKMLVDEVLTASGLTACFTPGKPQLKYDARLIADQVINATKRALKK